MLSTPGPLLDRGSPAGIPKEGFCLAYEALVRLFYDTHGADVRSAERTFDHAEHIFLYMAQKLKPRQLRRRNGDWCLSKKFAKNVLDYTAWLLSSPLAEIEYTCMYVPVSMNQGV